MLTGNVIVGPFVIVRFVNFFVYSGSTSYVKAVEEQKRFFPDGICCESNGYLENDEVCFETTNELNFELYVTRY